MTEVIIFSEVVIAEKMLVHSESDDRSKDVDSMEGGEHFQCDSCGTGNVLPIEC